MYDTICFRCNTCILTLLYSFTHTHACSHPLDLTPLTLISSMNLMPHLPPLSTHLPLVKSHFNRKVTNLLGLSELFPSRSGTTPQAPDSLNESHSRCWSVEASDRDTDGSGREGCCVTQPSALGNHVISRSLSLCGSPAWQGVSCQKHSGSWHRPRGSHVQWLTQPWLQRALPDLS